MAAPDAADRAARLLALVLDRSPRTLAELADAAGAPEPELEPLVAALERHGLVQWDGGRTLVDRATLEADLDAVRVRGYATLVDELEPGLSVVAAPVFDSGGAAVAALAVSGPTSRLPAHRLALVGRVAIEQAHAVSQRLGYHGALEDALP